MAALAMNQVAEFVNASVNQAGGGLPILAEDLSNIVDCGRAYRDANMLNVINEGLITQISTWRMTNRVYSPSVPDITKTGAEYGAALAKIRVGYPEATDNQSWALRYGESYDVNIYYGPTDVETKVFVNQTTFECKISIPRDQWNGAFTSATNLNAFVAYILNNVDTQITASKAQLTRTLLQNAIAETVYTEYEGGTDYTGAGKNRVVNLRKLYNDAHNTQLTMAQFLETPDALREAVYQLGYTSDKLKDFSKLFSVGGHWNHTPKEAQRLVLLSPFVRKAKIYLYDAQNQFNTDNLALPEHDIISYWQGAGEDYDFETVSSIDVKTCLGHDVDITGVVGVLFDEEMMMIANEESHTNSNFNPAADFTTMWNKNKAGYFIDFNENCVVFTIA